MYSFTTVYRIADFFGGDINLAYFGDLFKFTKIKIANFACLNKINNSI